MPGWTKKQNELVERWADTAIILQGLHFKAAKSFDFWDKVLGIPAVILSTITASATFSVSGSSDTTNMQLATGGAMMLAAALGALQNFVRYGKVSEKHLYAAGIYANVRMDVDEQLAMDDRDRSNPRIFIHNLKSAFAKLSDSCPGIPDHIMRKYNIDAEPSSSSLKLNIVERLRRSSITTIKADKRMNKLVAQIVTEIIEEQSPTIPGLSPGPPALHRSLSSVRRTSPRECKEEDIEVQFQEIMSRRSRETAEKRAAEAVNIVVEAAMTQAEAARPESE